MTVYHVCHIHNVHALPKNWPFHMTFLTSASSTALASKRNYNVHWKTKPLHSLILEPSSTATMPTIKKELRILRNNIPNHQKFYRIKVNLPHKLSLCLFCFCFVLFCFVLFFVLFCFVLFFIYLVSTASTPQNKQGLFNCDCGYCADYQKGTTMSIDIGLSIDTNAPYFPLL